MKVRDAVMARIHHLRDEARSLAGPEGAAEPAVVSPRLAEVQAAIAVLEQHVGTTYVGFLELECDHAAKAAGALYDAIAP